MADSSAVKFTRLIPGNVCEQDEGMVMPVYTLLLIQQHAERIPTTKIKTAIQTKEVLNVYVLCQAFS